MDWIKVRRSVVKFIAALLGIAGAQLSTERTNMKKFWMVYVEGTSSPTQKHESLILAKEEAERLVLKTGRTTYVLEATLLAKPSQVEFEVLEE